MGLTEMVSPFQGCAVLDRYQGLTPLAINRRPCRGYRLPSTESARPAPI